MTAQLPPCLEISTSGFAAMARLALWSVFTPPNSPDLGDAICDLAQGLIEAFLPVFPDYECGLVEIQGQTRLVAVFEDEEGHETYVELYCADPIAQAAMVQAVAANSALAALAAPLTCQI